MVTSTNPAQDFKYNGKELEESLGLNLYEMDARAYDPAIARWTSIDPVTHHSMSTYTAFDNNPIYWADPNGADAWTSLGDGTYKNNKTGEETKDWQRAVSETVETVSTFSETKQMNDKQTKSVAKAFINNIFQHALDEGADDYASTQNNREATSDIKLDKSFDLSVFPNPTTEDDYIKYIGTAYIQTNEELIEVSLTFIFSKVSKEYNIISEIENMSTQASTTDGSHGYYYFIRGKNRRLLGLLNLNSNNKDSFLGLYRKFVKAGYADGAKQMDKIQGGNRHRNYIKRYNLGQALPSIKILSKKPKLIKP